MCFRAATRNLNFLLILVAPVDQSCMSAIASHGMMWQVDALVLETSELTTERTHSNEVVYVFV